MRSFAEYVRDENPVVAGQFLAYSAERYRLAAKQDPKSKRTLDPRFNGDEQHLYSEVQLAFENGGYDHPSIVEMFIKDAFKNGEKRTFEIICLAYDNWKRPHNQKHFENVRSAMLCASRIMLGEQRHPTKSDVIDAVILELGDRSFAKAASERWREVLGDAHLKLLKKASPIRGKTKHGSA